MQCWPLPLPIQDPHQTIQFIDLAAVTSQLKQPPVFLMITHPLWEKRMLPLPAQPFPQCVIPMRRRTIVQTRDSASRITRQLFLNAVPQYPRFLGVTLAAHRAHELVSDAHGAVAYVFSCEKPAPHESIAHMFDLKVIQYRLRRASLTHVTVTTLAPLHVGVTHEHAQQVEYLFPLAGDTEILVREPDDPSKIKRHVITALVEQAKHLLLFPTQEHRIANIDSMKPASFLTFLHSPLTADMHISASPLVFPSVL